MSYSWLIIPLSGALIGWFTNWVALKLLFRPKNVVHFGPWNIQGLIPRRQKQLAVTVSEVVSRDLFSGQDLAELMQRQGAQDRLLEWIRNLAGQRVDALLAAFPMAAMFLGPDQLASLKDKMVEGIDPKELVDQVAAEVVRDADLRQFIEAKIAAFDLDKLEEMVQTVAVKEFRFIEVLGAVLGGLIGVLQVFLLS